MSRRVLPLSSEAPLLDSPNSTGSIHQQQFCLRWNNHQTNFVGVMEQLLHSEALVDVTIAVDGGFLPAHRVVLSACSPYFEALFARATDKQPLIVLPEVSVSEAQALLSFMYRGEVSVREDRLARLLRLADTLRVRGLAEVQPSAIPQPHPIHTQHLHQTQAPTTPPVAPPPEAVVHPPLATPTAITPPMQHAQPQCQQPSSPSPNSVRNRSSGTKRPLAQSPAPPQQQQQQHPSSGSSGPEPSDAATPVLKRRRGRPRRNADAEQTSVITSTASATTTRARRARLESTTSVKIDPEESGVAETPPPPASPSVFTPDAKGGTDEEYEIGREPPAVGVVYEETVTTEETWGSGGSLDHHYHVTHQPIQHFSSTAASEGDDYSNLKLDPDLVYSPQHFEGASSTSWRRQQRSPRPQIVAATAQLSPEEEVEAELRRKRDEEFVTRIIARVREECEAEGGGGAAAAELKRYRRRTRTFY